MIVVILSAAVGFSSTMISYEDYQSRETPTGQNNEGQNFYDKLIFWLQFLGTYKSLDQDEQKAYYSTFATLIVALAIEKQCINWLVDRWGCNYNAFQKCIELETRKKFIDKKWGNPPAYDPGQYHFHYFYKDLDQLLERFKEETEVRYKNKKQALKPKDG